MENENIRLVKSLVNEFMNGNGPGYIDGCSDDFHGKIFSGLIPGGEEINGKEELVNMFNKLPDYIETLKFEPVDWCGVGDVVYFTVNWEFIWKPTNKKVTTSANVKKIVRNGKICEKYHILNYHDVMG